VKPSASLPRRDLWLLPLICLLTAILLFTVGEAASRLLYAEQQDDACALPDPALGTIYRHDCTATVKTAEGPWVVNRYNDCGYRSDRSCGPVPAGTRRIALIGASLAQGWLIPEAQTTGATLAAALARACGAPVDMQNLGSIEHTGYRLVPLLQQALALKPQAVVLMIAPHDIEDITPPPTPGAPPAADKPPPPSQLGFLRRLFVLTQSSRLVTVAQHFLFRNPDIYLPLYLRYQDQADFLRVPLKPAWQDRVRLFDALLGRLAAISGAADVPLVLVYAPQQAQAGLLARRSVPQGVDPLAFDAEIGRLAARHGVIFHDATLDFRALPDPMSVYYAVDGHIAGAGQTLIGAALARQFLSAVPGFTTCAASAPVDAAKVQG
jgi:hypothetical protein